MKLPSERYKSGEKALSHQEYKKLIDSIADLGDEVMVKMGVALMLRREDLCNILVEKLNLDDKTLEFYEEKKNKTRLIFLDDTLITLIKKYLKTIPEGGFTRKYKGKKIKGFLFKYQGRTAYRRFNYWCRIAGIDERPIHGLRATGIKFAHDAGWSDEEISKLSGDKISTIQEHYRTPTIDDMRTATNNKPILG